MDFMPHGHYYFSQPYILWPTVIGDVVSALAYFAILFLLFRFFKIRIDPNYKTLFVISAAFTFACGTIHLLSAISIWYPLYLIEGIAKLIMAGISLLLALHIYINSINILTKPNIYNLLIANEKLGKETEEHKLTQQELQAKEKVLQGIFNSTSIGIALVSEKGNIMMSNRYFNNILGYEEDEIKQMTFADFTYPDDLQKDLDLYNSFLANKIDSYRLEKRYIKKNGAVFWVDLTVSRTHGEIAKNASAVGIVRDLSKEKQIQLELDNQKNLLIQFIKHTPAAIAMLDAETRYLLASQKWYEKHEMLGHDVIGKSLSEVGPDFMLTKEWEEIKKSALEGQSITNERTQLSDTYGKQRWIRWQVYPWMKSDNVIGGIMILTENITARIEVEQRTMAINDELEEKVKARTIELTEINKELEAFSYSVSHDLRAPLRAISGYSNLIHNKYNPLLDQDGKEMLGYIIDNANKLGILIDRLLDFSRIGRKALNISHIDSREMVTEIWNETWRQYGQPNIKVTIEDLPNMNGDKVLMQQIWRNLISNAIKYSSQCPTPEINIRGFRKDGIMQYQISDNGVGFNMKYVDKIFDVFQRLHNENDFEGIGVGLAFVQRIVNKHRGKIWVESEIDKGSTFFFSIPQNQH